MAAWSTEGPARATLPRPAAEIVSRDGEPILATGRQIEVTGSPRLVRLVDSDAATVS